MPKLEQNEMIFQGIGIPIETMITDPRVPDDVLRLEFEPLQHHGHVLFLMKAHRPKLADELFHTFDFSKN
ncbi:MAG TPA: hypothetical protein P5056_00515 [Candidatus Paceibacterota bacterium]|nr:hypothetical protein [Candidatus Paceibacterota bacterium]